MKKLILFVLLVVFLNSCKQEGGKVVQVEGIDAIEQPITITFDKNIKFGEVLTASDPIDVKITIKNNSSQRIENVTYIIPSDQTYINYRTADLSSPPLFPGFGGTCGSVLESGLICSIYLTFNPQVSGNLDTTMVLNYKNLLNPVSESYQATALIGTPALILYETGNTFFDYGVIEQTELSTNQELFVLKNAGELSAKNISIFMDTLDIPSAFSILSNDCPSVLAQNQTCSVIVEYVSQNNLVTDPPAEYNAELKIDYEKDPSGGTGSLNSKFKFLSTKIQGDFDPLGVMDLDFTPTIVGNQLSRNIKFVNNGFQDAIFKKITFYDSTSTKITDCIKGVGTMLDCQVPLSSFPFLVDDTNNCFENRITGKNGIPGSCMFDIYYQPSVTFANGSQAVNDFNDLTYEIEYDSLYKNNETIIVESNIGEIDSTFLGRGDLEILSVSYNQNSYPFIPHPSSFGGLRDEAWSSDFGDIPLLSTVSQSNGWIISVVFRNNGESAITNLVAKTKNPSGADVILTDFPQVVSDYYTSVKVQSCDRIDPGATCTLSMNLRPEERSTNAEEQAEMFDVTGTPSYRQFVFDYDDGAVLEDDGTSFIGPNFEFLFTAELKRAAYLRVQSRETYNVAHNSQVSSLTYLHEKKKSYLYIINEGTGTATDVEIKNFASKGFIYNAGLDLYRSEYVNLYPPCRDVTTPTTIHFTLNALGSLAKGAECYIEFETDRSLGLGTYPPSGSLTDQLFYTDFVSQDEPVNRLDAYSAQLALSFSMRYCFDAANCNIQSDTQASFSFNNYSVPVINPSRFWPSFSSIAYRPSFTLNAMNDPVYLDSTAPYGPLAERYYFPGDYGTALSNQFTFTTEAQSFLSGIIGAEFNSDDSMLIHFGTYPVGMEFDFSFSINNFGGTAATDFNFNITGDPEIATVPFTNISIPYEDPATSGGVLATGTINAPLAGRYHKYYEFDYVSGYDLTDAYRRSRKYHLVFDTVDNYPKIDVSRKDYDVWLTGTTVNEAIQTTSYNHATEWTSDKGTPGAEITITSIKGSTQYAKTRVFLKNNPVGGNLTLNDLQVDFFTAPGTPVIQSTSSFGLYLENSTCLDNMNLPDQGECFFDLRYQPQEYATNKTVFLNFVYEIAPDQYISQFIKVNLTPVDPAELNVEYNSLPLSPMVLSSGIQESYPISIGTLAGAHTILSTNPTNITLSNIKITNLSITGASFLKMNPAPTFTAGYSTIFSDAKHLVEANEYCFYGDDGHAGDFDPNGDGIGFLSTSVNDCLVRITFYGGVIEDGAAVESVGGSLYPLNHVFQLDFYNDGVNGGSKSFHLHLEGDLEPPRSTGGTITSIETDENGTAELVFTEPVADNEGDWGSIIKYNVYYSLYQSILSNHSSLILSTSFEEVPSGGSPITVNFSGLNSGTVYYFKVLAVREYNGSTDPIEYFSRTNDMAIDKGVVPVADSVWFYNENIIVNKSDEAQTLNKPDSISHCQAKSYGILDQGVLQNYGQKLLTNSVWTLIKDDLDYNNGQDPKYYWHWLSDPAVDISVTWPGYTPGVQSVIDAPNSTLYQKTCDDETCNDLDILVGGDNVNLFYDGVHYFDGTSFAGFIRCYAELP